MKNISIIIATSDPGDQLSKTLGSLKQAIENYGKKNVELLLADNSFRFPISTDLIDFAKSICNTKYFRTDPGNKSLALNTAIKKSSFGYLAFTDDDTLPDINWLNKGIDFLLSHDLTFAGGKIIPCYDDNKNKLPKWLNGSDWENMPLGPAVVFYSPMEQSGILNSACRLPLGANIFAKKDVFLSYGGYDELLWKKCGKYALGSEDAEFAIRLRNLEIPIGYSSDAVVHHPVFLQRASLINHIEWAYALGYREPLLFPLEYSGRTYLLKEFLKKLFEGLPLYLKASNRESVKKIMEAFTALGQISGEKAHECCNYK